MRPTPRALAAAGLAAVVVRQALAHPPGDPAWAVTNHRGEQVTRWGGAALAQGVLGGTLGLALSRGTRPQDRRALVAVGLAATASGVLGAVDDLSGGGGSKGLAGHLGALRRGEVTTGAVKIVGLGVTGLLAAAVARDDRSVTGLLLDGALVAGSANLVNLLDLRPGRAGKLALVAAGGLPGVAPVVVAGAALAVLPDDLDEKVMLGDCGANALGAALAAGVAGRGPTTARAAALAAVVGLTLASERVSFSQVIAGTPWLARLDMIGRRPVDPSPPVPDPGTTASQTAASQTAASQTAASQTAASSGDDDRSG